MVFFKKVSSLTTTFIILKIIERNKIMNINIKRAIFAVALTFITGVSVSAVKMRLSRGRKLLEEKYRKEYM
jgi:hypothetical protein